MCGVERALITCGVNFVNTPEDVQSRELIVRYHLETFSWPTNQPLQFTLCTEAYPTMKLAVLLSTSERNALTIYNNNNCCSRPNKTAGNNIQGFSQTGLALLISY